MKISDLIQHWGATSGGVLAAGEYPVRLPLSAAARISALAEMYPPRTEAELISDLVAAALDELQAALPYVPGNKVIAEDDRGDPIYEDVGPTPRFIALQGKYRQALEVKVPERKG
jgi:hypothetical protein